MKKIIILAISALFIMKVSAQDSTRVEADIKRLTHELMLSDQQAAKFAVTFREYNAEMGKVFEKRVPKKELEPGQALTDKDLDKMAKNQFELKKDIANLQSKYYTKFRKDLSARQVRKVIRVDEPCCGDKPGHHRGFRPDCKKHEGPRSHFGPRSEGPAPLPAPQKEEK